MQVYGDGKKSHLQNTTSEAPKWTNTELGKKLGSGLDWKKKTKQNNQTTQKYFILAVCCTP